MSLLFTPITLRGVTLRNRVGVSPMCQYACGTDGLATPWHLSHLGSRATGGAALVVAESTAVSPEARISPGDLGLWSQAQMQALAPVADFIRSQGAAAGIQLGHAGRKGAKPIPWVSRHLLSLEDGGWEVQGPSALAFSDDSLQPRAMAQADIDKVVGDFAASARLAATAGFNYLELHMGHGYLGHQFLSPLSNQRTDSYGGSFENRARFVLEATRAVRAAWPHDLPLSIRLSCTDWRDGGWDIEQTVRLASLLRGLGVDLVVCSSGAVVPGSAPAETPGVHVPFSEQVRQATGVATGAVGFITEAQQAEAIVQEGRADLVFLARAMLRDPYWAIHAAEALGAVPPWPLAYKRAVVKRAYGAKLSAKPAS